MNYAMLVRPKYACRLEADKRKGPFRCFYTCLLFLWEYRHSQVNRPRETNV